MAHFTDTQTAARQGNIGDTIAGGQFHWGYGRGDYEIVWVAASRRLALAKGREENAFKFFEASGLVINDSFIGPEWTTEKVLRAVVSEIELAEAAAKADEHERIW